MAKDNRITRNQLKIVFKILGLSFTTSFL